MQSLDHVNIDNENFLYLVLNKADGCTGESNEIKYLVFASTDENKEALKNTQNFGVKLKIKLK